ncbi:metallophosphoesterase family protein [Paenibacillus sp. B-A-8]|uniref:metallophosphoesterase family protein n=1 Tax=Paenibacillus sp. B-A-8 TaxID=3400419 RepID=UPI003B019BC7
MTALSFDLISDLHIDHWLNQYEHTKQVSIEVFVDALVPANPSEVLIIAGDLGHHNSQNEILLRSFRRYYKTILLIFGNHDLYLVEISERWHYEDSMTRLKSMQYMAQRIEGVIVLDGSTITIDGITYGGAAMWHDWSYGVSLGYSKSYLYDLWHRSMNDSNLIFPIHNQVSLENFFEDELSKLERIFDQSQVIITHVGPDTSSMESKYQNSPVSTFFYFDGLQLLDRAKGKVWCFGHAHTHVDYQHREGCRLINNALGYPQERTGAKIRTIQL